MIAYITSIGESTTDICKWSLQRNGFETVVIDGDDSLASKLKRIYQDANERNCDFYRVDADVIPNRRLEPMQYGSYDIWWIQFYTFDWYKQDITHGGIQYIKKYAIPALLNNIDKFMEAERPESQLYRLDEFDNPRRCFTIDEGVYGIHGYKQTDMERVKAVKASRKQFDYDFEMAERLNAL